ncbi:MAG: hypothetical protein AB1425_02690 [Actinomycetota bacterium]
MKLADLISAATRLPLLAVPLFLAVGAEAAGAPGLLWGALCIALTTGLSMLYLFYLTRSGKVRDPHSIARSERIQPLRVVAALHAAAFALCTLLGAPSLLVAALLSYALATLAFAVLVPFVNLSLHAAGITGAAVCLTYVFGAWGSLAFLLLPPVWWARITLKRHTPRELGLGTLVGGSLTALAFRLLA